MEKLSALPRSSDVSEQYPSLQLVHRDVEDRVHGRIRRKKQLGTREYVLLA